MHTHCPHCGTAFPVTAPALQEHSGRVACGRCQRSFNAVEHLTEDPSDDPGATMRPSDKADLDSLKELTGPHEIRIEDTGVEWQVLDEDAFEDTSPEEPEPQESLQLEVSAESGDNARYDDNSPLPERFAVAEEAMPRRRLEDRLPPRSPEADELQVDLALDDPEEWIKLLEDETEIGEAAGNSRNSVVDGTEAAAETSPADSPAPQQDLSAAVEEEGDIPGRSRSPLQEDRIVETIILEGDTVRNLGEADSDVAATAHWFDADGRAQERRLAARWSIACGVVILGMALAAQVVHAFRGPLATYDLFERTAGPFYRWLGSPLVPEWNVNAWHFESTRGSTVQSDNVLVISSRLANRGVKALPNPLLHLSLTNRWQETIATAVLEPGEYLDAAEKSRQLVPVGGLIDAIVQVASLPDGATGFKLNVCYPLAGDRLRCKTQDFRN